MSNAAVIDQDGNDGFTHYNMAQGLSQTASSNVIARNNVMKIDSLDAGQEKIGESEGTATN